MSQQTHHRRPGRAAASVMGSMALVFLTAGPGHAVSTPTPTYDAFAQATGIDSSIANESIPIGLVPQAGGPAADARQNSSGQGDASAQMPYTGATIPGLPGTLGSLFSLPVPPFPFIASSTRGGAPSRVSYPAIELRAESQETQTRASATLGSDGVGAVTSASVRQESDGDVIAEATSEFSTARVGGVLALSGVRTTAKVVADATTGKLTRTSSTSIAAIDVPGLVLTLPQSTPGTLPLPIPIPGVPNIPPLTLPVLPVPLGGTTIANPKLGLTDGAFTVTTPLDGKVQAVAIPAQPVLDTLKALGIKVTFQPSQEITTGVLSGGYTFEYNAPSLPTNAYFNGPTQIKQSTGVATATVDMSPVSQPGGGSGVTTGSTSGGPTGSTTGQSGAGGVLGGTTGSDSPLGQGSGATPLLPSDVELGSNPGPGLSPSLAEVPNSADPQQVALLSGVLGASLESLYLALVIVAGVAFLAGSAIRTIGVRFLWSS